MKEKGFALVLTIALMLFLSFIGTAIVFMSRQETKSTLLQKKADAALFLADAGIEYAIDRINNGGTASTTYTFGDGQFVTAVTNPGLGSQIYDIESTGYIPSTTTYLSKRKVVARVRIAPAPPPYSVRAGSSVTVNSNMTIKGALRSNYQIYFKSNVTHTESSSGAGDANAYTNTSMAKGIQLDSNITHLIDNCAYKSRGPMDSSFGASNDYPSSGIYEESAIGGAGADTLLLVEGDSSTDTDIIPTSDFPFFCLDLLSAEVYTTYDARCLATNNATFDFQEKTWRFNNGIEFNSNISLKNNGTIWVPSGTGLKGIDINSNVSCVSSVGGYPSLNFIVTGSRWDDDISIGSDFTVYGYFYGKTMVDIDSNVTIKGIIETAGTVEINSNMTMIYEDLGFPLPGSTGEITILSWRQERAE